MPQAYHVSIMSSPSCTTHVGFTSNLEWRVWAHKGTSSPTAHTRKDNEGLLVHIAEYADPWTAIEREKQLKGRDQAKNHAVIESENPEWLDPSAGWEVRRFPLLLRQEIPRSSE